MRRIGEMPARAVGIRVMPHVSTIAGGPHELFFFFPHDFCSGGVFMLSA